MCCFVLLCVAVDNRNVCGNCRDDRRRGIWGGSNNANTAPFKGRICQDRRTYATLYTENTMKGASIELRDTTPGRPSFRRDITGYKRFFREFRSQSQISS